MKILLGVPEYPPYNIGGGGEVFKKLAENYKRQGYQVIVVYGFYDAQLWWQDIEEYTKDGIKFYQIPEVPYPRSMSFLKTVMPPNLKAWRQLKRIIKEENPDTAHLHGYGFVLINILAGILRKLKINYILTLHGAPVSPNQKGGLINWAYYIYRRSLGRRLLKQADYITAVSQFTKTFPEFKEYQDKMKVIHNGIEISDYQAKNDQDIFQKYKTKAIICLSIGRIEWLKGFDYFIRIMPDLIRAGFNIKYLIAGRDNGHKNYLEKLIAENNLQDHVSFLGHLDFQDKINALTYCDYVMVPSLVENFPAVPLEAMTMGKIPIVNNVGGLPEIVRDKINGIIVDVKDREDFKERFTEFLKDKSLQEKIRQGLPEVRKYNWADISKQYLDLLSASI